MWKIAYEWGESRSVFHYTRKGLEVLKKTLKAEIVFKQVCNI
jgi:hypothetical protein